MPVIVSALLAVREAQITYTFSAIKVVLKQIQRLRNLDNTKNTFSQVHLVLDELDLAMHLQVIETFSSEMIHHNSPQSVKDIAQSVHEAIEILNIDLIEIEECLINESSWRSWMLSWIVNSSESNSLQLLSRLQTHNAVYRNRVDLFFKVVRASSGSVSQPEEIQSTYL
jgi:hypothetical protein